MDDTGNKREGKVTLDIELKDLVNIVSRSSSSPFDSIHSQHAIEGEELRKAWFKHVLLSLEKLGDTVQEMRLKDLVELRKELRLEFETDINRLSAKVTKGEESLETYKKEIINPIHDKLTILLTKVGIWSVLAGFLGSGLMGLVYIFLKAYLSSKGL